MDVVLISELHVRLNALVVHIRGPKDIQQIFSRVLHLIVAPPQRQLVVYNLAHPLSVSEEHESIHADLLISVDAYPLDEILLPAQRRDSGQKPAVSHAALTDIVRCGTIDDEVRILVDVLDAFDRADTSKTFDGRGRVIPAVEGDERVGVGEPERSISVLDIQALAFADDCLYLGSTG